MRAFDTGPGNVMIDHAMRRFYDRGYDRNGEVAATGTIHQPLIDYLLEHPFYARKPPRSAWRLDFGSAYADTMLDTFSDLSREDIIATLTRFTAISITTAITELMGDTSGVDTLICSGGGTRNPVLMGHLAELAPVRVTTSDEYGIPAQYKEAIKFGTLAFANLNLLPNNIPACSGATELHDHGQGHLAAHDGAHRPGRRRGHRARHVAPGMTSHATTTMTRRTVMTERVGWGIMGTGGIAHVFADAIARVEHGDAGAVSSRERARPQAFATETGAARAYGVARGAARRSRGAHRVRGRRSIRTTWSWPSPRRRRASTSCARSPSR